MWLFYALCSTGPTPSQPPEEAQPHASPHKEVAVAVKDGDINKNDTPPQQVSVGGGKNWDVGDIRNNNVEISEEPQDKVLLFNYKGRVKKINRKIDKLNRKQLKLRKANADYTQVLRDIQAVKKNRICLPEWEKLFKRSDKDYKQKLVKSKIDMLENELKKGHNNELQQELTKMKKLKEKLEKAGEIEQHTYFSDPRSLFQIVRDATPITEGADKCGDIFHIQAT